MRNAKRGGFTLIEQMIIIAMMGVWMASCYDLMPMAWKAFFRVSRDHVTHESLVRMHAYLSKDVESATLASEGGRALRVTQPDGRVIRYVSDPTPARVRREAPGGLTVFPEARLVVLPPSSERGAWTIRLESTAALRRPAPVLVSAWSQEAGQ